MKINILLYSILLSIIFFIACGDNYYFDKAVENEKLGQYEEAIKYLDIVILKNPKHYMAYINRGSDKSELEDFRGAIDDYTKAIELDSTKLVAYVNRANNQKRLKNYSRAIDDYNKTLRLLGYSSDNLLIQPEYKPNFQHLANRNKYEEIEYNVFDILFERGITFYLSDSLNQSMSDLSFCIDNDKFLSDSYYWRAFVLFGKNDITSACEDLYKAASLGNQEAKVDYIRYCKSDNNSE
ncbi:MAG: tetratricopeptide repeat protein [Bacteroidales bacterium]